ncbi:thioredoxin family protein [Mariniflexile ostreae]|uniref:Thioredoxin family protein n=1 Tax=Mariniflexile ostreae TaxID=1520892 RepID=A0ABV5F853_9FLAO
MKYIYLAFLMLTSILSFSQVQFEPSLTEAFKKAKQQNKPVFIKYYNSDCSVCNRLGDLLNQDAEISAYYNSNFINYAMNAFNELSDADHALLIHANLHFNSVPVLLYFDKDKNFLHHSSGDISSEAIMNEAKKSTHSRFNTSGLKSKFDAGDRTVRTLYAYCQMLIINKDEQKLKKVSQDLFESFNTSELPTKKSYLVLKRVVKTTDNGFFQYWINNLDKLKGFENSINKDTEISQLKSIVLTELSRPDVKEWSAAKKNEFKGYITKLKISDDPNIFF